MMNRAARTVSGVCLHLRAVVLWLFCEKWLTLGEDDILTKFAADHLGEHDTWLGMDRIPGDPITDPNEMINAPLRVERSGWRLLGVDWSASVRRWNS